MWFAHSSRVQWRFGCFSRTFFHPRCAPPQPSLEARKGRIQKSHTHSVIFWHGSDMYPFLSTAHWLEFVTQPHPSTRTLESARKRLGIFRGYYCLFHTKKRPKIVMNLDEMILTFFLQKLLMALINILS